MNERVVLRYREGRWWVGVLDWVPIEGRVLWTCPTCAATHTVPVLDYRDDMRVSLEPGAELVRDEGQPAEPLEIVYRDGRPR